MAIVIVGGGGWLGSALVCALGAAPAEAAVGGQGSGVVTAGRVPVPGDPDHWAAAHGLDDTSVVINAVGGISRESGDLAARHVDVPRLLARACASVGARLVHLGSAAECGFGEPGERMDERRPPRPVSPYGRAKLAGTEEVLTQGGNCCVVRIFNIAGWPLTRGTVFDHLVRPFCDSGEVVSVETPGLDFHRDYCDRATVAGAIIELAHSSATGLVHLCTGTATSGRQLIDWCAQSSGRRVQLQVRTPADTSWVVGDDSRLRTLLHRPLVCNWPALAAGFTSPTQFNDHR